MSQISACLNKVKKPCYRFISTQEISSEKFKNKDKMLRSFHIPVCFWMAKKVKKNNTMIVGLSGGQGTGKTTISSIIKIILEKKTLSMIRKSVFTLNFCPNFDFSEFINNSRFFVSIISDIL